ncbi:DUF4158 domain-containing protein [Streptomyces sp. NPDC001410]|uniref:DUF4158 domain-containing protein n=1 Tax=Streptomyces sp. NPDC001410 TaxID=3364574 RepID=UPI00368165F9
MDEGQLTGSFLVDQTARRRATAARGARNRIGGAVQLGTTRYPGTFLTALDRLAELASLRG